MPNESFKEALAYTAEPHQHPYDGGQYSTPNAELDSGEQSVGEHVRQPFVALLVIAKEVLGDGRPVPLIMKTDRNPIGQIRPCGQQSNSHNDVE